MAEDQHVDVIVIGSGSGGGTPVHRLASTGGRILLLERGCLVLAKSDAQVVCVDPALEHDNVQLMANAYVEPAGDRSKRTLRPVSGDGALLGRRIDRRQRPAGDHIAERLA